MSYQTDAAAKPTAPKEIKTATDGRPGKPDVIKLILLGDSGVGKTSLLSRFKDDEFLTQHITTIGIDFREKKMKYGDDGKIVSVQVYDSAGQERFSSILPAYYRHAQGVALCFDPTDDNSFAHIGSWLSKISGYSRPDLQIALVATKSDIQPDKRVVSDDDARSFAAKNGATYFATSARTGAGVNELFADLVDKSLNAAAAARNLAQIGGTGTGLATTATADDDDTGTCCVRFNCNGCKSSTCVIL